MVQETQTQWNWYQTPNLIPWVWISERRIKEHTQVTPTRTYICEWTSDDVRIGVWWGTPDAYDYGAINISSQEWWVEFREVDWWLRVPLAWIYEITWSASGGNTWIYARHDLMVGNVSLDHFSTHPSEDSSSVIVNLGKYDIIRYKMSASYSWPDTNYLTGRITAIKIQKL